MLLAGKPWHVRLDLTLALPGEVAGPWDLAPLAREALIWAAERDLLEALDKRARWLTFRAYCRGWGRGLVGRFWGKLLSWLG